MHTVLTDNGVQFIPQPHQFLPGGHSFDRICREYGLEHRLTKPAHPWTNGQVERMNRTIKEAIFKRFHYQSTDELNEHLQAFFARLQSRQAPEDPTRANPARIRLCTVAKEPDYLYPGPDPPYTGTIHLDHLKANANKGVVSE
ncbi:transposase family protein [Hymenobacter sp. P5252]|uniref:Transposase family protein n=1 Tax=Hymenobacter terrestris TaxID=2748310 RepID=A0ABX2Q5P9_9BACT|nr:transposase family protein [Hymenobacter terrestris]